MKINMILFSMLALFLACQMGESSENKPQKVYRIVYEYQSNDWYKTQAELWKKEIDKNPKNAEAWHNYYNAVRYANFEEIDYEQKKEKLATIIDDMGKAIPGTYEYYLLSYWTDHDIEDLSLIKKAHELKPDDPETFYPFIIHNEVKGDKQATKEWLTRLYASKDISPSLLNYNFNVLMSLQPGAVLITNGDNDTYPIWLLQQVHNLRSDVMVINISMALIDDYLELKLKEYNREIDISDLKNISKEEGRLSKKIFINNFRDRLVAKYPEIPFYYALTVYDPILKDFKDQLYIVGLTQRYSKKRIDNTAVVKKHLENDFRLDYLRYDWYREQILGYRMMDKLNMNYVVPMIMLAEHYAGSGEKSKAEEWLGFALSLAEKSGNSDAIDEIQSKKKQIL